MDKRILGFGSVFALLLGIGFSLLFVVPYRYTAGIQSFKDCVQAGYPVTQSFPRRCRAPSGQNFVESTPTLVPTVALKQTGYYGSSTFGPCQTDNDCYVNGCNGEICQSKKEKSLNSICVLPNKPVPGKLGFSCKCVTGKVQKTGCQWVK